ncbi:endolytic transglycosylase MltG [Ideonella azotifigens]|uniref:endolytic transglycosylase MltG n=1 Tax=Ideonella azotifigens TaxID=513160 RepID=UPI0011413488|nr:endolytic transglycosylase MltG [Ideonella azotifigens]MCD2342838.1 endolytic transglycosylase MltG [Ideonella azotifigens]
MKLMKKLLALLLLAGLAAAGAAWWWTEQPLPLRGTRVELSIEPGTSPREVAEQWVQAGVDVPAELLYQWFRWSGQSRKIRAGSYEIEAGVSPKALLDKMVRGEQVLELLRIIDGWNLRQVREAVAKAPGLRNTLASMSDAQAAAALGLSENTPEGWLFPDSYAYSKGVSDITVLKRARAAMQQRLAQAWEQRAPDSPLKSPAELLVLASVVEKETGQAGDRGLVAGVFNNRLRIGMPLQSDPTVIYGLGASFDGNLRKADLLADTPWNTYTRRGLPPTPIAMPGARALLTAAKPDKTDALYFVARGDGSSVFSGSLADHNRAVNQFQRGGSR